MAKIQILSTIKNIDFWHENTIFGFVLNVGNKIVFTIQFYVHGSWIIT